MKWLRVAVYIVVGVFLLGTLAAAWLLSTGAGARFILARSEAYFPAALQLDGLSGSLLRGLALESLTWSDETVDVRVENIVVDVELLPLAALELVVVDLDVGRSRVTVHAREAPADETPRKPFTLDLPMDILLLGSNLENTTLDIGGTTRDIARLSLAGSLNGPRLVVRRLTVDSSWLSVDASGRLRIDPDLAAELRGDWSLAGDPRLAGTLQLDGNRDAYRLNHRLSAPVELRSGGELRMRDSLYLDLEHVWQELTWPIGERRLESPRGRLTTTGPLSALSLSLDTVASFDDVPQTELGLSATTDFSGLEDIELSLGNALGKLDATGSLTWTDGLTFSSRFLLRDADPSWFRDELSGALEADGTADGRIAGGGFEIDTLVERFGGRLNDYTVGGSGRLLLEPQDIGIREAELRVGDNQVSVNGTIGKTLQLAARLDARDLSQILPTAAGAVRGNATIGGTLAQPVGNATVDARNLALRELSIGSFGGRVTIDTDRSFQASVRSVDIVSAGRRIDSADIDVNGTRERHRIRLALKAFDTALSAEARGGYNQPAWSGVIESLSVDNAIAGAWLSRASAGLSISPATAELSALCLDGRSGGACVEGAWTATAGSTLRADLEGLPLAALPIRLPPAVRANGLIYAAANLSVLPDGLTGDADLRIEEASIETVIDDEAIIAGFPVATTRLRLNNNTLDANVRLAAEDDAGTLSLDLLVSNLRDPSSDIQGQASINVDDASIFAALIPDLTNPAGRIDGGLSISGRRDVPVLVGSVNLRDASFGVRPAGISVTDMQLTLSQDSPASLKLRGSAKSGDGSLQIRGDTLIGEVMRTEIRIEGNDFELLQLPDWQASASPDVGILIDDSRTRVSGKLLIPTANIRVREIPTSAEKPSPDVVVHTSDASDAETKKRPLELNLTAALGDDVRLSAFGLRTGLEGSVRLRGGDRQGVLGYGRVSLKDGTYKAYGQDLTIESGRLVFNGPLDSPQLDVRAVRRIDDITAGILLTGTPTNLSSEVFSTPPMRDVEALSYLLSGRPLTSADGAASGDLLGSAAFALGLSSAGSIASRVQNELGLDTLSIQGGSQNGRIVAGKRLSERLLVEYAYGLADRLGSLVLRYQLNERLVLESRTGIASTLDLVYRVSKP